MNLNSRPLRVYADTTIFGGIVDVEFERANGYDNIAIYSPLEVIEDEA